MRSIGEEMIKHYRCPRCKKSTSAEGKWIPSCKCTGSGVSSTKMEEIKPGREVK